MTTTEHGLSVGDVLVSTWGYDQTNVDFFEVTRATAKTVLIRRISAHRNYGEHWGSFTKTPARGAFIGEPFRCKVQGTNESPWVKINSFVIASQWNGGEVHGSDYA